MKQKSSNGFTLIELLAVIVILAIIALIATPIILNIINDSKNSSNERSIELYAVAANNAVASYQLKENEAPTNFSDIEKYIDYQGSEVVCEISELNSDGSIYLSNCKVNGTLIEGYTYGTKQEIVKTYANGEVSYYDVTTGKACSNYNEENSKTGYNGIDNKTGNQNSCLKFYSFNYDGGDTVNLILDHNTTAKITWNSNESNISGPSELLTQLKADTDSWVGTITPKNYTMDQSTQDSKANYTIKYKDENYKARLITTNEIAQITGNTSWDETTATSADHYYIDSLTSNRSDTCKSGNITGCKYGWLYDRTNTNCTTYGCYNNADVETYGYWTSSSVASFPFSTAAYAWALHYESHILLNVVESDSMGVRPVIEVSKSNLS